MKVLKPLYFLSLVCWTGCSSVPTEVILIKSQEVVQILKDLYIENPPVEQVRLKDFNLLDNAYYEAMGARLEREGFRWLGDLEFKHLTRHDLAMKTCVRTFLHAEGTTSAAVWHLHPSPKVPKGLKTIEFETELSDGHWVISRNHAESKMRPDPEHVTENIRSTDDPADLFKSHQKAVQRYRETRPAVQLITLQDLSGVIAGQKRQALLEAAYRRRIGGVTEKELRALAPELSRKDIRRLLQEIQRLYHQRS
jgi:hypothetical protein